MLMRQGVTPLQAAEDGGPDQVLLLLGGSKRCAGGNTPLQQSNGVGQMLIAAIVVWLSSLVHRAVKQWWGTPQES